MMGMRASGASRPKRWAVVMFAALACLPVGVLIADGDAAERVARGPSADVRTRGAAGDGISDDSAAIQAALDAGADVVLPSGYSFLVRGLVASVPGQRISGGGRLLLADGANRPVLTIAASEVTVDGLEMDGNAARQAAASDDMGSGIWVRSGTRNVRIVNNHVHDTRRSGIAGYGNHEGFKISGNRIERVGFIGIYPSSGSGYPFRYGVISENQISDPAQDGIGTVAIQHTVISSNTVLRPGVAGIALEARCDHTTVVGNAVVGSFDGTKGSNAGIQVNDSHDVTITGNSVVGFGNGIAASGGDTSVSVTIMGNSISSSGTGIVATTGVRLEAYPYHATVSGNTVTDSYGSGILISQIAAVSVTGNVVRNWNRGEYANKMHMAGIALRRSVTDAIVANNVLSDSSGKSGRVGIAEIEAGGPFPAGNAILHNAVLGVAVPYALSSRADGTSSRLERAERFAKEPTSGSWRAGDKAEGAPGAMGTPVSGWLCISSGSYHPVDARVSGELKAGSRRATMRETAGIWDGMRLRIAGAGPNGSDFVDEVVVLGPDSIGFVNGMPSTETSGAWVTNVRPTFRPY